MMCGCWCATGKDVPLLVSGGTSTGRDEGGLTRQRWFYMAARQGAVEDAVVLDLAFVVMIG